MKLFCAIDIMGGEVVRLEQGEACNKLSYRSDPVAQATDFVALGARTLHIVDLDAAFGNGNNRGMIAKIAALRGCEVQVGGGLRSIGEMASVLDAGAWRVVVGSAAVENAALVAEAISRFGDRVCVGLDAREGKVRIRGWTKGTQRTAAEVGIEMRTLGVETLIYTDIARDGMLGEPDIDGAVHLAQESRCRVVVSGGVSELDDLARVANHEQRDLLEGVIVGKALYEKRFDVPDALTVLGGEPC